MQRLSINKISKKFFNITPQKIETYQTNPFRGSFRGNFLTADVFEKKGGESLVTMILNKSKRLSGEIVGSINKANSAVVTKINSAVSFGKKGEEKITELWAHAKSIEITFHIPDIGKFIKSKMTFRK